MLQGFYRFGVSTGFAVHLWKSATRQDHKHLREIMTRYLPRDGVAIDVGAHGGQITRLMSSIAPNGAVLAIEPSSYTRVILRVALWVRRIRNVVVVATALGAESGIVLIHTPIKKSGDMGYGLANLAGGGGGGRFSARSRRGCDIRWVGGGVWARARGFYQGGY